jgi:Tfp pilus assembly protein PilV
MEKTINKDIAGVSLVEVMVSLVLVAIALIAVVSVFPNMMKNRKGIHEADQAKVIATEALEYIQGYDCSGVPDVANTIYKDTLYMGSASYKVWWEPNCTVSSTSSTSINTATVYVGWRKGGKQHTIRLVGALR